MTCFQSAETGSDYSRVEVPMHIVPSVKLGSACLQTLVGLPSILTMEEEEAYQKLVDSVFFYLFIYCAPVSIDRGHIVFLLSVCL